VDAVFREAFELDGIDPSTAEYGVTNGWDSVGHLQLVLGLEEAFGISIDPDDVFEMRDYAAVRRILERRHAIGTESS
jgi:acyl carrier protein